MTSFKPGSAFGNRTVTSKSFTDSRGVTTEKPALFGSTLVAIYIFLITGRILDVSPIWFLHIPLILLVVLTVTMISRGDFNYAFSSKLTRFFAAYSLWVIICYPFSSWRSASLPYVELQLQSLLIFLIIVQVVRTRRDWEKVAGAYAYAILTAALLTFVIGMNVGGRVALPNGTLGDPNEFALHMVVGLPFWWFKASRATGFRKVLFLLCTIPIYVAFARAGSRAGLLAIGVLLLVTFLFAEGGKKVLIATVTVVAIGASSFVLPGYLKARFMTFFSPAEGNFDAATKDRISSDIQSSEERKALLMQSLSMTVRHPIFGVGPGDFSWVSRDERVANGEAGGENLVTHNTYTQTSSETGIPGFFLFAGTVVLVVRFAYSDFHRLTRTDRDLAGYSRYVFTAMAGLAIGIFFLSVGYTHLLGVMFALSLSLHRVVESSEATLPTPSLGSRSLRPAFANAGMRARTTGFAALGAKPAMIDRGFSPRPNGRTRNQYPTLPVSKRS